MWVYGEGKRRLKSLGNEMNWIALLLFSVLKPDYTLELSEECFVQNIDLRYYCRHWFSGSIIKANNLYSVYSMSDSNTCGMPSTCVQWHWDWWEDEETDRKEFRM